MKKEWTVNKNYLLLPIATGGEPKIVSFHAEGEKIYEFRIPVAKDAKERYSFHFFAPLPVKRWRNKKITISGELPEAFYPLLRKAILFPNCRKAFLPYILRQIQGG